MMHYYTYVETPNANLVCCICRMPFVDPTTSQTCSHTFCHDCIAQALEHSPHCPVDRSPLSPEDLQTASAIVRNLVDELVVECPQRAAGCAYTCQRQLLASHEKDACQFAEVPCSSPECENTVLRKDLGKHGGGCGHRVVDCEGCAAKVEVIDIESHNADCPAQSTSCKFCGDVIARGDLVEHNASCPDVTVQCTHAIHGCPWNGLRRSLQKAHLPSCPYESMKGFLALNAIRVSALADENTALRHKVEVFDGMLQTMRREMQAVKSALGPWYRPDGTGSSNRSARRSSRLEQANGSVSASAMSAARPEETSPPLSLPYALPFRAEAPIAPPSGVSFEAVSPGSQPGVVGSRDILAQYFPPEGGDPHAPPPAAESSAFAHGTQDPRYYQDPRHMHARTVHPNQPHPYARGAAPHTTVAPLNLSTTLEGSLAGLRESVVSLGAAVDALARRHDIALGNEALRLNEELGALRTNVHGLRLQVHRIMADRNAQVTGRTGDSVDPLVDGVYPYPQPPAPTFFYPPPPLPTPPFTKL